MATRKIKGSWHCDFWFDDKRYRRKAPLNTRGAAEELERFILQKLLRGESLNAPRQAPELTFEAFTTTWFQSHVLTNNKPSEQHQKRSILKHHLIPYFGKKLLGAIDGTLLESYKAIKKSTGLSEKTINNQLAVLSKILHSANEWGSLNIVPKIRPMKAISQRLDFLSPLESFRLLQDRTEPKWHGMVLLGVRTGMRPGELAALSWENVNLAQRVITVRQSAWRQQIVSTKTNRERHIPMSDDVYEYLKNRSDRIGLLFPRGDGGLTTDCLRGRIIDRICKRTGTRKITWYTLRHTFASQLAAECAPLLAIKEMMGHASIGMTMRYAHLSADVSKSAVSLLQKAEARDNLGLLLGSDLNLFQEIPPQVVMREV